MLAHKTRPRTGPFSGISLFLLVIFGLAFLTLVLPRFMNASEQAVASVDGYSTYRNDNYHYSVSYPSNWQIAGAVPNTSVTTIASRIAQPEQAGGRYSLKALNQATPSTVSANNFAKLDIVAYQLEENITAREFMATRSNSPLDGKITSVKVAGQDALMIEVQTAAGLTQREENLLYKSIFVTKGNYAFIIGGFADLNTFNHILQSFQID